MRSKHFRVTDIGYKSAEMTNICISLFSFVGDYFSTEKRYICCVLVLKKHKTQKIKENEKKMSFGEKNGDKKCNILCNNELCHFLSIAQNFSAQYSFELYLTN